MSLRTRNKIPDEEPVTYVETQNGALHKTTVKRTGILTGMVSFLLTQILFVLLKINLGPLTLDKTYADQDAIEDSTKFIEDMVPLLEKEGELEKLPKDLQDFLKLMETFQITQERVAKVGKNRIYSLAWHPGTCKLLLATGDRAGSIGKYQYSFIPVVPCSSIVI